MGAKPIIKPNVSHARRAPRAAEWRVGQRTGQSRWQVKRGPGWGVAHECDSLHEAAAWLTAQGVDLLLVDVCSAWPWRPLADHLAANL